MRLHAVGGLCNRLRAILSAHAENRDLTVVWAPDEYVSFGRFADVFRPLPGVTFVDSGPWDVEAFAPLWGPPDWRRILPNETTIAHIAESMPDGEYSAIHVRRTDHTPLARDRDEFTDDWEFRNWIRKQPESRPIYVATDNAETRKRLMKSIATMGYRPACGEFPIGGHEAQAHDDHRRWGPLFGAVVDIFVCVRAVEFMGSGYSSFSETIQAMRGLR